MFCHICVSLPEGSATLQAFKSTDFSQSRAWKLPADMGLDWQLFGRTLQAHVWGYLKVKYLNIWGFPQMGDLQ